MVPFQIKICGVTSLGDAIQACECGADAIGLNFFPKSSRFVKRETARQIVDAIHQWSEQSHRLVKIIGVFVNLPTDQLMDLFDYVGLDGIQLHGDEPIGQVAELRTAIGEEFTDETAALIVRAIRTQPSGESQQRVSEEIRRVEAEIAMWANAGVDAVLLDAEVAGEFGGTGKSVDWPAVAKLTCPIPLILAGGLTAENVGRAIEISQAKSVDVASGVEVAPGKKDHAMVGDFVLSAKNQFVNVGE